MLLYIVKNLVRRPINSCIPKYTRQSLITFISVVPDNFIRERLSFKSNEFMLKVSRSRDSNFPYNTTLSWLLYVKAQLGNSARNEDIGGIVLDQLCPAIHAILLDGLKTHVRSFFGKVKNSAWKVVEDSIDLGKLTAITAVTICYTSFSVLLS